MKRGWVWVALLLSVGINIGVLATIGVSRARTKARWERPRTDEQSPHFDRLANHLELEGEERQRFMEIQQRLFRITRQHRETLQKLRGELRREVMSDAPDPAAVDVLLAKVGETHMDLDRAMVESVLETRKILTPEQQRRYLRVLERMREAYGRFGSRGDGPPRLPGRRPPPPDRP